MAEEAPDFKLMAAEFAALDAQYQSTVFSFFTIDQRVVPAIEGKENVFIGINPKSHPYGIYIVEVHEARLPALDQIMHGGIPTIRVQARMRQIELPAATYLMIASPRIHESADRTNGFIAENTIRIVCGYLVAFLGRGTILTHVGNETVDADAKKSSFESPVLRLPQPEDNTCLPKLEELGDALKAMEYAPEGERDEMLYAWSVFGRAVREDDETFRFTLYWIALEVVAQTIGQGVIDKLAAAYGDNRNFAFDTLEMRAPYDLRIAVVHKGKLVSLEPRMERLMQLYFVELLRERLRMPCVKLAQRWITDVDKSKSGKPA
jgi:hypothetical protein